jgi:serine phosphatase RsbU (regulator of sigma subunit)
MATAVYAVLDLAEHSMTVSSAGHLPPILTSRDGPAELVTVPPDLPLGAYRVTNRRNTRLALPTAHGLFLYTDGLVERRGEPILDGIRRLRETLGHASADELCNTAMARLLDQRPASDDVAVLAIVREPPPQR